jgi:hypothetical protein
MILKFLYNHTMSDYSRKTIEIKWKQYVIQFLILIALHVLDSFDHQQVYMNKNNKYTTFMLNYMMKVGPFSTS